MGGVTPGAATIAVAGPSFHAHLLGLALAVAAVVAYLLAVRRSRWRATTSQRLRFVAGVALALAASAWPLGDLAAHWLLTALVVQRLVLLLGVAALLLWGTPEALLADLTRPAPLDAVVRTCTRPVNAVVVVTVVSVGTLTAPAVSAQSSSPVARGALELLLVLAGLVLWAPIHGRLPGTRRPSAIGCAAYLVVQSIVPSFLSVVWILSRHPLYPVYAHTPHLWGMAPLTDQIVAGFAAKFGTIAVLWTVAFVIITRADRHGALERGAELRWADVEREFQRVDRRGRRDRRASVFRAAPGTLNPGPRGTPPPVPPPPASPPAEP